MGLKSHENEISYQVTKDKAIHWACKTNSDITGASFRKIRNGHNGREIFLGKFPENPEIVEFPKSETFNK